jgi:hypothetical protein
VQSEYISRILSSEVQSYLREHESADVRELLLRHKLVHGIPMAILANQISGRRKARTKLPEFYSSDKIIYPPGLNLEQSSSERTARFKCETFLMHKKSGLLVDLTGGFGIDSYYFSKYFSKVIYLEPDAQLLSIAKHNHGVMGASNIEHVNCSAEVFLDRFSGQADIIYADPSRRLEGNRKVFALSDCTPDITSLRSNIFRFTELLMVKASPLLDIKSGIGDLETVRKVTVVAVDNDCKELIFEAVPQPCGGALISAVNLFTEGRDELIFSLEEERRADPALSMPLRYIFEPNVAVLKAGAFKVVAQKFALAKLEASSHLYTSENLVTDFPGRTFEVKSLVAASAKEVGRYFPDRQANIIVRNYPASVPDLKKRLKLEEGGTEYLIATSVNHKKILIVARRLK